MPLLLPSCVSGEINVMKKPWQGHREGVLGVLQDYTGGQGHLDTKGKSEQSLAGGQWWTRSMSGWKSQEKRPERVRNEECEEEAGSSGHVGEGPGSHCKDSGSDPEQNKDDLAFLFKGPLSAA